MKKTTLFFGLMAFLLAFAGQAHERGFDPFLVNTHANEELPIYLSELYPNPATDVVNFDYRWSMDVSQARIIFHNVIGNVVGEFVLDEYDTRLSIPIRHLESGIYFYTLVVDRQNVLTRKFIVRH
ncbi:MAG: T9SS type A sorting domain-containing protein [Bernardetiaceae bacterium]